MTGGHGHVTLRPDGARARCGGPAICAVCAAEKAQLDASKRRVADMVAPTLEDKEELDAHMFAVEAYAQAVAGEQSSGLVPAGVIYARRAAVRASAMKLMGLPDE